MKLAQNYKNWNGPYELDKLLSLNILNNTKIWFPDLCPSGLKEPFTCTHLPITMKEFKRLNSKPQSQIYYHGLTWKAIIMWIGIITTILLFITTVIEFSNKLFPAEEKLVNCINCLCHCEYEDIIGKANDKEAKYRFIYLTAEKRWKYNDEKTLQDGTIVVDYLVENLTTYDSTNTSKGFIAVGVASQEAITREREEIRGQQRADEIVTALRLNELTQKKEIYSLNLGQYTNKLDLSIDETSYQRRVIIISIMERDSTMSFNELKQSLIDAMRNSEALAYEIDKYSKFDLKLKN